MHATVIDYIPLWAVFILTVTIVMFAVEAGFLLGKSHKGSHADTSTVSTMVGAALGLLAFMLAFTFGMAGSRYEVRKELVIDDANAIRTTYLRADLLKDPERAITRSLLREYIDMRVEACIHPEIQNMDLLVRIEKIQEQLWANAMKASQKEPGSNTIPLFIQSLNDSLDTHIKRISIAYTNRIPGTIWMVLYSMLFFSMAALGYYSGITVSRSRLIAIVLAVAFSSILLLIDDLDRPQQGFIKISQQAMIRVRNKIDADDKTGNIVKTAVDAKQSSARSGDTEKEKD
ncbi:MAG TPA: hypothetical protein DCZ94_11245 [Lentisphaeria bacterium]|nr:MAG: hypothetical protein A2X48_01305 [Lentisphaerae bacterium GWF2_49_21]HBC87521.1 hypothetical protein [Lentisphaeria bacterium]